MGKVLLHFPQLPSTNQYAVELLAKSKPVEGTVISTFSQTAGRGQIGSKWESGSGQNITISIILYPSFVPVLHQFILNQAVALGVYDFLTKYIQSNVKVKWPNDIYVNEKKIAGILLQTTLSGSSINTAIIGVGINVNQDNFDESLPNPTSMRLETGSVFPLDELIEQLCLCLEYRYLQLRQRQWEKLQQAYLRNLFRFGMLSIFRRNNEELFQGKIEGVSEHGKLLVSTNEGLEAFDIKEVSFVLP